MIKNNVLIGKDSWLFLWDGGQNQFDYLRGILEVDDKSVENFISNLIARNEYFLKKGVKYKHVVFSSKPLVKKRYIPSEYADIKSLFNTYYLNKCSELFENIIYPLDDLVSREERHSTFHKLDSHNTDAGYYEVATQLLESLAFETIPLEVIPTHALQVSGDLAKTLGSLNKNMELYLNLPFDMSKNFTVGNREFLPGNTNDVLISFNLRALTDSRVLIFGDSFFKGVIKFLKPYFKDILYVRSSHVHKEIVEGFQPDIVFSGNAERYLNKVESDLNASNFLMCLYGNPDFRPSESYVKALTAQLSYSHYPEVYQSWAERFNSCEEFSVKDSGLDFLQSKIKSSFKDADILREVSLYFEQVGNIQLARDVMYKAHVLRPSGPIINKKLSEYNNLLESE